MKLSPEWRALTLTERRAEFVYEAARLAAIASGAPVVPSPWREREEPFRSQFLKVIERQCGPLRSGSPEELHESWVQAYLAMGWRYGPEYDRDQKVHPDLVPYGQLGGRLERDKDAVFIALCEVARQWIYEEPDPVSELAAAVAEVERDHPLPRCEHDAALRDHAGERLEPPVRLRARRGRGGLVLLIEAERWIAADAALSFGFAFERVRTDPGGISWSVKAGGKWYVARITPTGAVEYELAPDQDLWENPPSPEDGARLRQEGAVRLAAVRQFGDDSKLDFAEVGGEWYVLVHRSRGPCSWHHAVQTGATASAVQFPACDDPTRTKTPA